MIDKNSTNFRLHEHNNGVRIVTKTNPSKVLDLDYTKVQELFSLFDEYCAEVGEKQDKEEKASFRPVRVNPQH